jgi:hypothetical protein
VQGINGTEILEPAVLNGVGCSDNNVPALGIVA